MENRNELVITQQMALVCGFGDLRRQYEILKTSIVHKDVEEQLRKTCEIFSFDYEKNGSVRSILEWRGKGKLDLLKRQKLGDVVIGKIRSVEFIGNFCYVVYDGEKNNGTKGTKGSLFLQLEGTQIKV